MDPWELSRADPPLQRQKGHLVTPPRIHRDAPGFVSSSSASLPARSAHTWKGPAASISLILGKSGSGDRLTSTLQFHRPYYLFEGVVFGFFPLGWTWLSAIWCPGEVTKVKFSTKIISQGEICFLLLTLSSCFQMLVFLSWLVWAGNHLSLECV